MTAKYQVTIQAETIQELVAALQGTAVHFASQRAMEATVVGPGPQTYSEEQHLNRQPQPLPFAKDALIPPPAEYVCPEHNARMNHKPAGVNRQGTPYAAGFRCPVSGCRQFVPDGAAA